MNYKVVHDGVELGQFETFLDADLFVRPLAWAQRLDPLRTGFEFYALHGNKLLATVLIGPYEPFTGASSHGTL